MDDQNNTTGGQDNVDNLSPETGGAGMGGNVRTEQPAGGENTRAERPKKFGFLRSKFEAIRPRIKPEVQAQKDQLDADRVRQKLADEARKSTTLPANDPMVERPRASAPNGETKTERSLHPYIEVIRDEFITKHPEQRHAMEVVTDEIARQGIENFHIFQSELPGVAFSYTTIRVTKDLIDKIAGTTTKREPRQEDQSQAGEQPTQRKEYIFCFGALAPPNEAHALMGDNLLHNVIRALPMVSTPLRRGETPPDVEIVLVGSPIGTGGHVTEEYYAAIKSQGADVLGKINAELITHLVGEDPQDNTRVTLHGVSRGAVVADRAFSHLPEKLKTKTQTRALLDNPAGSHERRHPLINIKGMQAFGGLVGEGLGRMVFDKTARNSGKKAKAFLEAMTQRLNIQPDDKYQEKLKQKTFLAEAGQLYRGSPLDTDNNRLFIRQGIKDPLTTGPSRFNALRRIRQRARGYAQSHDGKQPGLLATNVGRRSMLALTEHGLHFWIYEHFDKWDQIFDTVKLVNTPPTLPPDPRLPKSSLTYVL